MKYSLASISNKENGVYQVCMRGKTPIRINTKEKSIQDEVLSIIEILDLIYYWQSLLIKDNSPNSVMNINGTDIIHDNKSEVIRISMTPNKEIIIFDGNNEFYLSTTDRKAIKQILTLILSNLTKNKKLTVNYLKTQLEKSRKEASITYNKLPI